MENKISERNVVLGLTIVSIILMAGVIIMPSVAASETDLKQVYDMSKYAYKSAHDQNINPWVATGKVIGGLAGLSWRYLGGRLIIAGIPIIGPITTISGLGYL